MAVNKVEELLSNVGLDVFAKARTKPNNASFTIFFGMLFAVGNPMIDYRLALNCLWLRAS